jgi:hypothetical protein
MLMINSISSAQEALSAEAEYLYAVGLIKGTGDSLNLDQPLNRVEAAVMIVRLRGDEALIKTNTYTHPFKDVPAWAEGYVGYLYTNGLTKGINETLFGSSDLVSKEQFVTFLLRVLNYDDSKGDFQWNNSLIKAKEIGLITTISKSTTTSDFLRRDMMALTYKSLLTQMKNQKRTLQTMLIVSGALPDNLDKAEAILSYETYSAVSKPATYMSLRRNVEKMIYDMEQSASYDLSLIKTVDLTKLLEEAKEIMNTIPMYSSLLKGYKISRKGNSLTVTLTYNITKAALDQSKVKSKQIIQKIIKPEMNDFEKELAIHDYIVDNVVYDSSTVLNDSVFTIYGALIKGKAVCHGYAEAFEYLAYLAGLNSTIVLGEATSNGVTIGHAWNLVKLNNEYYHVDTTWDDPVTSDGRNLRIYDYFNITDSVIMKDHSWNTSDYQKSVGTKYNYFSYNNMEVAGLLNLKVYLQNEFDKGNELITVKVTGVTMTMNNIREVLDTCYGFGRVSYKVNTNTNVVTIEKLQ